MEQVQWSYTLLFVRWDTPWHESQDGYFLWLHFGSQLWIECKNAAGGERRAHTSFTLKKTTGIFTSVGGNAGVETKKKMEAKIWKPFKPGPYCPPSASLRGDVGKQ